MRTRWLTFAMLLIAGFVAPAPAQTRLVCEGVLGNSGGQGDALVRFGEDSAHYGGMGVAIDEFGSLWDRAGEHRLNRYAVDGRLLAHHEIPRGSHDISGEDQIAVARGAVVLKLGEDLFKLETNAESGAPVEPLRVEADRISFNARRGAIAAWQDGELFLVHTMIGDRQRVGSMADVASLDVGPDGAIYAADPRGMVHRYAGSRADTSGWPRRGPGARLQFIDDHCFGHLSPATIRRFQADLTPDPGVVLGGAVESASGYLDVQPEIGLGRGLAKIRDGLFAVSGQQGIIHLLRWDATAKQFAVVRRIGAVPQCQGLALDSAGRVFYHSGTWRWSDGPDAPLVHGVVAPSPPGIAQPAVLDDGTMVAVGWQDDKPVLLYGRLDREVNRQVEGAEYNLPVQPVGLAVYEQRDMTVMLVVDDDGDGRAFALNPDGSWRRDLGIVRMRVLKRTNTWTSLAVLKRDKLVAAADGAVIEMAPLDNGDWREIKRWSTWGSARGPAMFGRQIYLAADAGRLWISDRQRHRVLVFDIESSTLIAQFGRNDTALDTLDGLEHPQVIAARGDRAVVYDAGNQRILKLRLPE